MIERTERHKNVFREVNLNKSKDIKMSFDAVNRK